MDGAHTEVHFLSAGPRRDGGEEPGARLDIRRFCPLLHALHKDEVHFPDETGELVCADQSAVSQLFSTTVGAAALSYVGTVLPRSTHFLTNQ